MSRKVEQPAEENPEELLGLRLNEQKKMGGRDPCCI
jgi:hypothetical protein